MRFKGWTDSNIATLKRLYDRQYKYCQIAAEIGCSRSAAIGKAKRLRLPPRPCDAPGAKREKKPPKKRKLSPKPTKPAAFLLTPEPLPAAAAWSGEARVTSVVELQSHHCRWPIGDPVMVGFCGADRLGALPYCETHARRAYRVVSPKKTQAAVKRHAA
jgi:GcrA cell cycle regulator